MVFGQYENGERKHTKNAATANDHGKKKRNMMKTAMAAYYFIAVGHCHGIVCLLFTHLTKHYSKWFSLLADFKRK